jgi:hypothetical protein
LSEKKIINDHILIDCTLLCSLESDGTLLRTAVHGVCLPSAALASSPLALSLIRQTRISSFIDQFIDQSIN